MIAVARQNGVVEIYQTDNDIFDANTENTDEVKLFETEVTDTAWHPSKNLLASASINGLIRILDTDTGEFLINLEGHNDSVNTLEWNPNGEYLAAGDSNGIINIWNIATGEIIRSITAHDYAVYTMSWHPDGTLLASFGLDNALRIWNLANLNQE